ncbi:MAG: protein-L-isoaspartate(D-aspartate) O-methyltransferase [Planctomycetes bacterium]|nr:protein-L-isoaspartate(D-aspartate) O-methyltransferase [Planctomycetota bacterium]
MTPNDPPNDLTALPRRQMARLLRGLGIEDERVLAAMESVPRHLFLPPGLRASAYENTCLPIGCDQTISQPFVVARMTELLELRGPERVLEIGTGSGYQTAILAELAREVYSIERIPELGQGAAALLRSLGHASVFTRVGDGSRGWPEQAPFDGILVTAAAPKVPGQLLDHLAESGRLVIPVGDRAYQVLEKIVRAGRRFEVYEDAPVRFVPLIGAEGW